MDSHSVNIFEQEASDCGVNRGVMGGLKTLFLEYCSNSTVHGVKYFGCKRRTLFEKIWWVATFLLSVYGSSRVIQNIYDKWNEMGAVVSFVNHPTPIWDIPFPAVTICPETKALSQYINFTRVYSRINETHRPEMDNETFNRFRAVAQVCDFHIVTSVLLNQTTDPNVVDLLRNVSMPLHNMFVFCYWRKVSRLCAQKFTETITNDGICFTFNSLSGGEMLRVDKLHSDYEYISEKRQAPLWSLENGYSEKTDTDAYPERVLGAGFRSGLVILLNLFEQDMDFICRSGVQGFKILLHSPDEFPQMSKQFFRVPLHQQVTFSVKPQLTSTSNSLRGYTPKGRQCFFADERYLRFFKVYTQQNCEMECLTNYTLHKCGCVKFSMMRDNLTEVCGASMIDCYNEAEDELWGEDVDKSLDYRAICNCLPACTSIQYDAEISQIGLDFKRLLAAYRVPLGKENDIQFTRLSIYFKETELINSKRSEIYTGADFLANCGGLLGLFMGISLLSLAELFYYCLLRPFALLRIYWFQHRNKSKVVARPRLEPKVQQF
ncbi:pickpocket protein 28-like [Anopheles aquasalis]|uniref:pickpocket protein 28-like n=1 Tax=Anopheles aquasalis TaxID=42839 RepID=UPI00215A4CFB|nr:pickpocket protein 28-like [Anopheles aquasalis]